MRYHLPLAVGLLCVALHAAPAAQLPASCQWIGNDFPGIGENGAGEWVQDAIDQIALSPDGTVLTTSTWDEAGRCTWLYKDGAVNHVLIQQTKGERKAWGWGTAGTAVAVAGERFLILNTEGELLRFSWKPGDLNSAQQVDQVRIGAGTCLAVRGDTVAAVLKGGIVALLNAADLTERSRFTLADATRVAIAADGSLWLVAGHSIVHRGADGSERAEAIAHFCTPSAIAIDPKGRLVVCDNGRLQQVLVFDISAQPRLLETFGDEGGIAGGMPGHDEPHKLYALRGANYDADGNLYVAMGMGPGAGTCIRSFDAAGALRWQVHALAFVNCYDIDPASDGRVMYGLHEIIEFDPAKPAGKNWRLRSITCDPVSHPDDPRATQPTAGVTMRHLQGKRVLFAFGQAEGGPEIYAFPNDQSDIAVHVGRFTPSGWAWSVDGEGAVWWGDGPGKLVRRYPFKGWRSDGSPSYDLEHPDTFPAPEGFATVCRVQYVPGTDTLYIGGDTQARPARSWGLIGTELARYDGWTAGSRGKRWQIPLPQDDEGLTPKCVDVAGDHLFTVFVKSSGGKPSIVTVFRTSDGSAVGTMAPGPEVGNTSGWVDMTHGLRAFRRTDGSYVVVVEEDARAKNLVYGWTPSRK